MNTSRPPEEVRRAAAEQQEAGERERVGVDDPLQARGVKPRSARIDGSATFTIETSRMTMNCARQQRTSVRVRRRASVTPVTAMESP